MYPRDRRPLAAVPRVPIDVPRWLLVVTGAAVVAVGVVLVVRPLDSLTALSLYIAISCVASGVGDLLARRPGDGVRGLLTGLLWCGAGIAVLVWAGRSVSLLGPFVAALLVGSGAVRLLRLQRGTTPERLLDGLFGLAEIAFGLAALLWPDATLLVVAILFGVRCVGFGASLVWSGLSRRGPRVGDEARRRRLPTAVRWVAGVLVVVVAGGTLVVGHAFREGVPVVDGFYDAPSSIPGTPGQLLRTEPYAGNLPAGMTAYRILYTTTADEGVPALASAVVAVPTVATGRAFPSLRGRTAPTGSRVRAHPASARTPSPYRTSPPWVTRARRLGHRGDRLHRRGHPRGVPVPDRAGEGRSVLDSIRAAHQVEGLDLAGRPSSGGTRRAATRRSGPGSSPPPMRPSCDRGSPRCRRPATLWPWPPRSHSIPVLSGPASVSRSS